MYKDGNTYPLMITSGKWL